DLKKKGNGWEACCPFHNENTPSFRVNPSRQIYKCFGCGKGGDMISFVKDYKNLTFAEAVQWIAEKYNISFEYDQPYKKEDIAKRQSREKEAEEALKFAENYYHNLLLS